LGGKQVCVDFPRIKASTLAAARALMLVAIDRYLLLTPLQTARKRQMLMDNRCAANWLHFAAAVDRRDGRTDGRTDTGPLVKRLPHIGGVA